MRWCPHCPGDNPCCGHFGKTKYPVLRKRNHCFAEEAGQCPNLLLISVLNAAHFRQRQS